MSSPGPPRSCGRPTWSTRTTSTALKDRIIEAMNDSAQSKSRRMRMMRRQVFEHDIEHWADLFLSDLQASAG